MFTLFVFILSTLGPTKWVARVVVLSLHPIYSGRGERRNFTEIVRYMVDEQPTRIAHACAHGNALQLI